MKQRFQGWDAVADCLRRQADAPQISERLNPGQRASVHAIAERIVKKGVVIADEVGMGKTRIAVEVARCVMECGGRAAFLVPPGLGYQWQAELREGGVNDVPPVLRSLWQYLKAWDDDAVNKQPWFEEPAVMVSHAFTNWHMGENTPSHRWALLPEIYAHWRKATHGQFPHYYHDNKTLEDIRPFNAANQIVSVVPGNRKHPVRRILDQLLEIQWPRPLLDAAEYSLGCELRPWLERGIGCGLGVFDLVVIDEAHKSRSAESCLSRLLENVIVSADEARRLALTATPVELDVRQWKDILRRIGLDDSTLESVQHAIEEYAQSVKLVRQTPSNPESRAAYKTAARSFEDALSPYLIRRDKREDPHVQKFREYSQLPFHEYRTEKEIHVETNDPDLPMEWRDAICAAESLSMVKHLSDDSTSKLLRLTMGSGHGIAKMLDLIHHREEDDGKQSKQDEADANGKSNADVEPTADTKRQKRGDWWLNVIGKAFAQGKQSLYTHPAILKAVDEIEKETARGEKVLVFGRFTRPLRAMVDLLNAREMLRRIQNEEPWPQTKVHGDENVDDDNSQWPAVRAAHRQMGLAIPLETLDDTLRTRYEKERRRQEQFREHLIARIEAGWETHDPHSRIKSIFNSFKNSVAASTESDEEEKRPLVLVAKALMELMDNTAEDVPPSEYTDAFCELIEAVSDRDDMDDDEEMDDNEAIEKWDIIQSRLADEYNRNRPQGSFARLMNGGTRQESRRMIQLAFNRPHSFPRVLVAQSIVGREGLNLHKACRIVILLHAEWNPAVVEQQIGRVDRVKSHWCCKLDEAIDKGERGEQPPRIEVRPVIFRGTYDEHNWQVLRTRWDDLRAQLHGIVIPPSARINEPEYKAYIKEITNAAPNFSPTKRENECS